MPRLTPQRWQKLVRVFERAGFVQNRTSSSHVVMVKDGITRSLIIPKYKAVGRDIILNNLRSAGISRDDYLALLDDC